MKKIFYLLTLVAVTLTACNNDPETKLEIGNVSLEADAAGGTYTFNVNSNSAWTITTDNQTWYTVTPTSGQDNGTVTVTVEPYTDAAGRSAQITVTADDKIANVTLVQARPAVPSDPEATIKKYNRTAGTVTFEAPEGYTYKIACDSDWARVTAQEGNTITVSYDTNASGSSRTATFSVMTTDDQTLETFTIEQSANLVEKGQLVIEEVFFTGTAIPDGDGSTSGDQYIKITNNCDETVYADSLIIGLSALSSNVASTGAYFKYPETPDSVALSSIYMVPGKGRDVAIEPGKSIVLAIAALDYSKDNPGAVNLSKADFEFYDENDIYPDTDNADVPNLVACALQFVSPRSGEDRPADTASCHEARVGGVDDGVYVQMGDVLANQGEWHVGLACVGGSAAMRPLKEECTAGGAACLPRALLRWRKGLADMR